MCVELFSKKSDKRHFKRIWACNANVKFIDYVLEKICM